jgi:serine/threonine protein kinase
MEAPAAEAPKAAETPHVATIISSDSIPAGGFTPGTILADRYRVIGLLGRGGMGEVYRADDLKLGQPVALKFLPPKLADDPVRRERFFAEVRITRQLSHPNICRVYDIGEIEGRHFLSMEFHPGSLLPNRPGLKCSRCQAFWGLALFLRRLQNRFLGPFSSLLFWSFCFSFSGSC